MTATFRSTSNSPVMSEQYDANSAGLSVVPWSKFGTRRLYVNTADGQQVGWIDLKTGHRTLAMPDLAPAFELAVSRADEATAGAAHSATQLRALDEAIELALLAGQAEFPMPDSPADDHGASECTEPMRHAYRGKHAYSTWDLGARGKRLVEEPEQPVSPDPRMAYLNSMSVATRAPSAR